MSTYSINSQGSVAALNGTGTPPIQDQGKALEEALGIVKAQAFHMNRCLDANKLMDALKHASTMLAELRTSALNPKYYYELYMAIFDELRHLSNFLYDAHISGRHHLSDLYELVQYAANIIPRLYLMITVGSVYMRVSKEMLGAQQASSKSKGKAPESQASGSSSTAVATDGQDIKPEEQDLPPIKELMRDMLEMARGVQHPTRGLFLRYYLSGLTRDHLPDSQQSSPHGTIEDSIHFVLQNFIEMNKLWVRLQHQGHSREREKREQERRELRLLIGSNLVRLSQLEELNLTMYQTNILPSILQEIVSCRDVIAQEYLMDVVIQVFPDDFHLRCLDQFLTATVNLQRTVNVKQIVISLIDRFAAYAARAREEATSSKDGKAVSGIPDDVQLFEVFWKQITELIKGRPEFTTFDIIGLLTSIANLSLNCYPDELAYIDKVLGMAKDQLVEGRVTESTASPIDGKTRSLLLQLLLSPIQTYHQNVLRILDLPSSATKTDPNIATPEGSPSRSLSLGGNYTDLLFLQSYSIRREIAHAFAATALRAAANHGFAVDTVDGVHFLLGEVCTIMVRDQLDGGLFGPKRKSTALNADVSEDPGIPLDWEDAQEEQTFLAKMVHLISSRDQQFEREFELLSTARNHFGEGGNIRIRFTLPPIVMALIKLARKCHTANDATAQTLATAILRTIHETIISLGKAQEHFASDDEYKPLFKGEAFTGSAVPRVGHGLMSPPDMSLRLHLLAAQVADAMGQEEMCYEFFVQALTLYEESVSESKAQVSAMTQIIATLYTITVFGFENYETLITKCAVHCSRLLKRVDQCRGVMLVSHLFWADDSVKREEGKPAYRDGKRVLECLQKALKIADSVMDPSINVELFVEILERYVWFYEQRNDTITVRYLNSLIELIQTNISAVDSTVSPSSSHLNTPRISGGPLSASQPSNSIFHQERTSHRKVSPQAIAHFRNALTYLATKRETEAHLLDGSNVIPGLGAGFAESDGGRWGQIEIPRQPF
eukprot:jgi/Hompol1/1796/HPOL_004967-RA